MTSSAIFRGVAIPIAILLLAFFVFFVAGMRGSLGPLDLATVSWIAGAQWVLAPVVGGLLLRKLDPPELLPAAAWLGTVVGLAATFVFVFGAGTAAASCVGIGRTVASFVLGCLALGGVLGLGMAGSLMLTARLAHRDAWLPAAVLGGTAVSWLAGAGALTLWYSLVICLR